MSNVIIKRILLVGGGGHCHSVMDSLILSNQFKQIGVVARDEDNYSDLNNDALIQKHLIGVDSDLPALYSQGWRSAFISLGSIGDPSGRIRIFNKLIEVGFNIPVVVDPTATISKMSIVAMGSYVGKSTVVNSGSQIGECSILNSGAIIEHDCTVGKFCHVSPGAVVCGNVIVGDNSHIGAGAIIRQGIIIGKNVLIGAGSVVVNDIPDGAKAYGNPCRLVQ